MCPRDLVVQPADSTPSGGSKIFLSVNEDFTNPTEEQFRRMFRAIGLIWYEEDFFYKYVLVKSIIVCVAALAMVITSRYVGRMVERWSCAREQKSRARIFWEYLMIYLVSVCVVGVVSIWMFNMISSKMIDSEVERHVERYMASVAEVPSRWSLQ